jgi:hypothetical protein
MAEIGNALREPATPELTYYNDVYSITSAMILTIAHGLPKAPRHVWLRIKCITAEQGWSVGDELEIPSYSNGSAGSVSVGVNKTQIKVAFEALPFVTNFSTNATAAITAANWNLVVKAEL